MSNFYQSYYQGNYRDKNIGLRTDRCVKEIKKNTTKKQTDYFYALLNFLKENGFDTAYLERPKNNRDCSSKINAMNTLLKKNGLYDKFYGKEEEK